MLIAAQLRLQNVHLFLDLVQLIRTRNSLLVPIASMFVSAI